MSIRNKTYIKKIVPGIISMLIILGMAVASFATNVDMEAFVTMEDHMTQFNEVEWRINDLDAELERLYKFTCTNVKTFGGSGGAADSYILNASEILYGYRNQTATYHWYANPIVDLSEEGYLRFNTHDQINGFSGHGSTTKWEFEVPATLCKWADGIEPAPNCKFKYKISMVWPNTTARSTAISTVIVETIMGPFKKFKKYTTGGTSKNNGLILETDRVFNPGSRTTPVGGMYYAYDTTEEPTSWTRTDATGTYTVGSIQRKGAAADGLYPERTIAEMEANPYDKLVAQRVSNRVYMSGIPTTDFSKYTNFWIRTYETVNGSTDMAMRASMMNSTITSWNHNK